MLSIKNDALFVESPTADRLESLLTALKNESVLHEDEASVFEDAIFQLRAAAVFSLSKGQAIAYIRDNIADSVERARTYAYFMHAYRNLKYDTAPYSVHLDAVVRWAKTYAAAAGVLLTAAQVRDLIIVAYCHDLIEDTGETFHDAVQVIGLHNAERVYQLTNEKGRNRAERANEKYYGEMVDLLAKIGKISDRTANMERGTQPGGKGISMLEGYLNTNQHFRDSLYLEGEMDAVWDLFDAKSAEFKQYFDSKTLELKIAAMSREKA